MSIDALPDKLMLTTPTRQRCPGIDLCVGVGRFVALWLALGFALTVGGLADEPADAISLEAYSAQIERVVEIVTKVNDGLDAYDDEEKPWQLDETLPPSLREELYRRLPEQLVVQTPTGTVTVRNQPLRETLDALCAAKDEADMRRQLRTLEAQLNLMQSHLRASVDGSTANIEEILAREAFQPIKKTKTPLEQLREWLLQLLEKLFGKLPKQNRTVDDATGIWSNQWVQLGLWIGLTALLIVGVLWIIRRMRRQAESAEDGVRIILGESVARDMDADEFLAQARVAAEAGDWRQAVRKIYIALLHDLDKRDIVPLNPAWTNREYLAAVRAQSSLYPAMRELTDRFDWLWYGQQPGSREDYERCLSHYQTARADLPVAA